MDHLVISVGGVPVYDLQSATLPDVAVTVNGSAVYSTPKPASSADVIRAKIAEWRAAGSPWDQVGFYLNTGFGIGHALSPEDWEVAYEAGYPRPDAPADTAVPGDGPFDPYARIIDWNRAPAGSALNYYIHEGGGSKMVYVPDGYQGEVHFYVGEHNSRGDGFDVTLTGQEPKHVFGPSSEVYVLTYPGPANVLEFAVKCDGEAVVIMRHVP